MASIDQKLEEAIHNKKPGTIMFTNEFEFLGNPGAVNIAIHRAEKKGMVDLTPENGYISRIHLKWRFIPLATGLRMSGSAGCQDSAARFKTNLYPIKHFLS